MPVSVGWDDETHNAIRFDLVGKWTWDEFFPAFDQASALIDSVEHHVSLIFHPDRAASLHYPPDMAINTRSINKRRHERMGLSLTVTENSGVVIRTMVRAASAFLPKDRQTQFVNSLEEARAMIARYREQQTTTPPR